MTFYPLFGLKNKTTFLTLDHFFMVFSRNINRDKVKSLATEWIVWIHVDAIFACKWHRLPIIYKMRHFVMYYLQPQKYNYFLNSKSFDNF